MNDFMLQAMAQARLALKNDEVPIGAVIVKDGKILSRGRNSREKSQMATGHAELIAIEKACKKLGSWRLDGCEIYVTLEPCPMCAGAIANARIKKLVYACPEKSSQDNLCEKILSSERLNHKVIVEIDDKHQDECSAMLTEFFKSKR